MRRTPGLERRRRPPQAMPMPKLALGGDEQVVLRPEVKLGGTTELQPCSSTSRPGIAPAMIACPCGLG
jgi:hypothetical protein